MNEDGTFDATSEACMPTVSAAQLEYIQQMLKERGGFLIAWHPEETKKSKAAQRLKPTHVTVEASNRGLKTRWVGRIELHPVGTIHHADLNA